VASRAGDVADRIRNLPAEAIPGKVELLDALSSGEPADGRAPSGIKDSRAC
jgi:hypothetical protein